MEGTGEKMISIISLIYRSPKYADFLFRGINKHTDLKDTEFYFVVNNGTDEIKNYLKEKNIPHYIFDTEPQPPYPQNIGFIYRAWNFAVKKAKGDIIVLLNSDMWLSKDWLVNLQKNLKKGETIVTSRLVEPNKIPSIFPWTIVKNFGFTAEDFKENEFEHFADFMKVNTWLPKGTFMPVMFYKEDFEKAGGYPEGNIEGIGGDFHFFYKVLEPMGIKHLTAADSIVYHLQEGEVRDGN